MKPMLAKKYEAQPVQGWWLSEKLDGIRAIWDGEKLISRNGNTFSAPEWFTRQLPAGIPLDGELYIGRGQFQATASVVKKKTPIDTEWQTIRFHVFDAPAHPAPFEQRLAFCQQTLTGNPIAQVVEHRQLTSERELETHFASICALGGEGIMLRAPGSPYTQARTSDLLKYKPFDSDEAELIGHEQGEGKFTGKIGALILRWKDIIFKVGTGLTEAARETLPAIGTRITFGYCGLTDSGTPRFPTFIAARNYE